MMRKVVYYVASSLDGFICGLDEDISAFVSEGSGVDQYLADLAQYDTVIMGRKTYEFGYKFGLKPGQKAYPHMAHYIFSTSLTFDDPDPNVHVCPMEIDKIESLKRMPGTDIYLCGGGAFAGWLLEHNQIDVLKIKLNPIILGKGVRLFGPSKQDLRLELTESQRFDHGLQIMTYQVMKNR